MARDFGRPSASMEGRGSYNRHSLIPSDGGAPALPHLERAIAEVPLEPIDQPVVIADYGSSQGLNSLVLSALSLPRRPNLASATLKREMSWNERGNAPYPRCRIRTPTDMHRVRRKDVFVERAPNGAWKDIWIIQ
jgi:hypothetical protein